jgi:2-iminobutanoate/2-iminopropanoate deaminase
MGVRVLCASPLWLGPREFVSGIMLTGVVQLKKAINTDKSPAPTGAYSQGLRIGDMTFVSGQGPMDPTSASMPVGIEFQSHQVLRNIRSILEAAGCGMDDVVRVTAHLADIRDIGIFNLVYAEYFTPPYPVRTTVGSQLQGILVEVDAIAVSDRDPDV